MDMKRTRQRQCVQELLEHSAHPLTANEMFGALTGRHICLSTLYRILKAFVQKDVVTRSTINGEAAYELNRHTHRHYAVCTGCRKMVEIDGCPIGAVEAGIADRGFRVTGHNIEIYGICAACAGKI